MGWRDWLNSGGLFGGYGEYGSALQQPALDRAKKYGMAAAAAQLMNTNPYDTRYGTKLFGSLLAGKMAMREQLAAEQEAEIKARLLEEKAKRDAQEWEWKKAEADRKQREHEAKLLKMDSDAEAKDAKDFSDFESEEELVTRQSNLIASRTGIDPNAILALPKSVREKQYGDLLFPKPKPVPKAKEPPKRKEIDPYAEATRIYRSEKIDDVDPVTGKVVKKPAFGSFNEALAEAQKRIAAATGAEPTTGASPLAAFARKGLEETGDEGAVLAGLIAKGYTKAQAIAAIEEAKRLR